MGGEAHRATRRNPRGQARHVGAAVAESPDGTAGIGDRGQEFAEPGVDRREQWRRTIGAARQDNMIECLPLALYRIEGLPEQRFLAWSPPRTAKPSFHVPEAFGTLVLDP